MSVRRRRPLKTLHEELPDEGDDADKTEGRAKNGILSSRWKRGLLALLVVVSSVAAYVYSRPPHPSVRPLRVPKMKALPEFERGYHSKMLWGTYRPGTYFGLRMRKPKSLMAGLMWLDPSHFQNLNYLRHGAVQNEVDSFGWVRHDGSTFGVQEIVDGPYEITTSWVKSTSPGSWDGGDWVVRISTKPSRKTQQAPKKLSLFFYMVDENGPGEPEHFPLDWELVQDERIGETGKKLMKGLSGKMDWGLYLNSPDLASLAIRSAARPTEFSHNLTEQVQLMLIDSMSLQWPSVQPEHDKLKVHLPEPNMWWESPTEQPNLIVFQVDVLPPQDLEFVFLSGEKTAGSSVTENERQRFSALTGERLSATLRERCDRFDARYGKVFGEEKVPGSVEVAKRALSNLLGGVGYFHGSSRVGLGLDEQGQEEVLDFGPDSLYTAVPSRSFFPRGFLWDEGFHQLLVQEWSAPISMDVLAHWLDRMNSDGWIPREQILGKEAEMRVPSEFVTQRPMIANPPTLFLPLLKMAQDVQDANVTDDAEVGYKREFLERAWPRLQKWFEWFTTSQAGPEPGAYRWKARDGRTNRELNPKTLDSGLDDYPRASHPTPTERHLDLRCWIGLASDAMLAIGEAIGAGEDQLGKYQSLSRALHDMDALKKLHYDPQTGHFSDFGLHTESVKLEWVTFQSPNDPAEQERRLLRSVSKPPEEQFVPHFGYVSLFPLFMQLFRPTDTMLGKQLTLLRDPDLLWTDYGLRSLANTSSLYKQHNTEHDAPYWRGAIWINMNFLCLRALKHYSEIDGLYRRKAEGLYSELRANVLQTIVKEYERTGYLWEQYDDQTGEGKGSHPFTGWTALMVLIAQDKY